jgi:hypothetical protein
MFKGVSVIHGVTDMTALYFKYSYNEYILWAYNANVKPETKPTLGKTSTWCLEPKIRSNQTRA